MGHSTPISCTVLAILEAFKVHKDLIACFVPLALFTKVFFLFQLMLTIRGHENDMLGGL